MLIIEVIARPITLTDSRCYLFDDFRYLAAEVRIQSADCSFHDHFVSNNIGPDPALDFSDRNDQRFGWIDQPAAYILQIADDFGSNYYGVYSFLGSGSMSTFALNGKSRLSELAMV